VLRLFEQHNVPARILVSLPSLEGIKRAVAMRMGVALLPRRCAESEIARGELVALEMPEIRLSREVRLVYRDVTKRSHASAAFLGIVEGHHTSRRKAEGRKVSGLRKTKGGGDQADQPPT
jgi:DNA-binding transcriptional LysR family regulator